MMEMEEALRGVDSEVRVGYRTVRTGIIGPHARTLGLPLLVRSVAFFFLFVSE